MKLMTYNVHSGMDAFGKLDLEGIAKTIKDIDPDICVLNEVRIGCPKCGNIDQSEFYGSETGMYSRFAKAIDLKEGVYGIALLSKYPIESFEVMKVPTVPVAERKPRFEERVIEKALINTPCGRFTVFGSHFGLTDAEQLNATELLLSEVRKADTKVVFMGDLNMTPDNENIKRISKTLTDTDPEHGFTFSSVEPFEKIDYIFVSPCIEPKKAYTVRTTASDHMPRITEI